MKKILLSLIILLLVVGCGQTATTQENEKLVVSATLDPHSKILEFAKPLLAEKGIDLEIQVLDDYYVFNPALDAGEVDANYFQHVPFFDSEVAEHGYQITNVAGIHIEPFGFYSKNITDVANIPDGAQVIISNSVSDQGRILSILAKAGVIELDSSIDVVNATISDITSNPKNITFTEVKPELLVTTYENGEGDLVAINGNYAIQGGLNPVNDSLILEQADSTNPYVNIIAVKTGTENDEKIKTFIEVMTSDDVKQFITETYSDGSVIPAE